MLEYPSEKLEILVARGQQPSVQRNAGMRAATGEILYFLDDDSVPEPANLRSAVRRFEGPGVQVVGGPNLCPSDAPPLEQVFGLVLASWLAFGPSRARYTPVGEARETSEKELILCNLLARRETMLALGGFDEKLYPNEENALMDQIQQRGGKLLYDPALRVYRRPRPTLKAFARMLMTYGRGRAEQFRVNPGMGSALNFVPPLFCLYLLSLVCWPWTGPLIGLPLLVYVFAVLGQALMTQGTQSGRQSAVKGSQCSAAGTSDGRRAASEHQTAFSDAVAQSEKLEQGPSVSGVASVPLSRRLAVVPLIALTHVLYGLGFWRGLFTKLGPPSPKTAGEVRIEKVPPK